MIGKGITLPNRTILPLEITRFCQQWHVTELALFGSILRDDFGPDSDVDLLVTFAPDYVYTLRDLLAMETELQTLLGRKVDLVVKQVIEASRNYIRRKNILNSAQVIYAA